MACFLVLAALPAVSFAYPQSPPDETNPQDEHNVARPQEKAADHPNPLTDDRDRIYYPGDTERFKPLMHKLVGNIILDQKGIWLSPFHMNRRTAPYWIGFAAVGAALIATDHHSSTIFENSAGQVRWGNNISRVGASYTLIPLIAGFYAYGVLRDEPKPREVGVLGVETLLDSLITVELMKVITRRARPDAGPDNGKFFNGGSSFPSGHSMEMWSIASLIAQEYKPYKSVQITAYSLAGIVSLARFAAQKHFASDIFIGGAIGWFIGRYVYRTHMDHSIHHHVWSRPKIMPYLDARGGGYGISLRFGN